MTQGRYKKSRKLEGDFINEKLNNQLTIRLSLATNFTKASNTPVTMIFLKKVHHFQFYFSLTTLREA